ncbi:hypothetical protein CRG98_008206 [Punica granatum]|uniref:Uncharacterized protein n=1 Tax=Punica granatum TaxID=22663 RepID=A0A2I0KSE7_PUNGR|nr:hypothetical protein CRG98_008206 [Punica granatum]
MQVDLEMIRHEHMIVKFPERGLKHHLSCTKIKVTSCPAVPDDEKSNMLTIYMRSEDLVRKKKQASSCGLEDDDVVDLDNDDEDAGAAICIDFILEDLEKKLKLLYMVDLDEKLAMGFIYNEMEKAKQKIKANFKDDRKSYDLIWKVIDERWEVQLHKPLHAAAYYLNSQLHFSSEFRANMEVMRGLYKVMDMMLDDEERDKVDLQLKEFKHERWLFGF